MSSQQQGKKRPVSGVISGSLKDIETKRRQVFKPVLDNPYTQAAWPWVEAPQGEVYRDILCTLLEPLKHHKELLKTKPEVLPEPPLALAHATLGFNSTVKALERCAPVGRGAKGAALPVLGVVFVCKSEITPAVVTQHFPVLCYVAGRVKLVQLPRGSMDKLSEAVGRPHTGIVGITRDMPGAGTLVALVEGGVGDVEVPWLEGVDFQKPVLKVLKTSAPMGKPKQKTKPKQSPLLKAESTRAPPTQAECKRSEAVEGVGAQSLTPLETKPLRA